MRCHYLSDLHLESQSFRGKLVGGDVLIIAGDLCHASALDPDRTDPYRLKQRDRVLRFADQALDSFAHVLMVPGNHEHYDGIFEDTVPLLSRYLPRFTVLDDEALEIDGVRFFGTTLWTDLGNRCETAANAVRRGMGEYFFVRTRRRPPGADGKLAKLQPVDTLAAHELALARLADQLTDGKPTVVISHHAPSLQGLNPQHRGNALDGAFASNLESQISSLNNVPIWVHGHTHIRRRYRIGNTDILVNCRGFEAKDTCARSFTPNPHFEL